MRHMVDDITYETYYGRALRALAKSEGHHPGLPISSDVYREETERRTGKRQLSELCRNVLKRIVVAGRITRAEIVKAEGLRPDAAKAALQLLSGRGLICSVTREGMTRAVVLMPTDAGRQAVEASE